MKDPESRGASASRASRPRTRLRSFPGARPRRTRICFGSGATWRFSRARVATALAPRVAAALARTLGDAAAAAATEVLCDGAAALTRARDSGESRTDESFTKTNVNARSAAESLDARLASDVVRRCAVALGQLKGVTAAFRMTNKPMPTKPSHFANGVVEPLRRFAESGAVREASAPTRRALVDAAVAGVCAAYEKAAADLTVSVRKTEASLIRLKDRKGRRKRRL